MDKRLVRRKTRPSPGATSEQCRSHLPADDDSASTHSVLSLDADEAPVNDTAHRLYLLAIEQAREERRQARVRQQHKGRPTVMQRQALATKKKKALTIADIDRLFEEKRQRAPTIRADLMDLYQKSRHRIRSLLDIHQIEQFVQSTRHRLAISEESKI